jgi:hypothetical protein
MGHRPMYCATDDTDDCTNYEGIVCLNAHTHNVYIMLQIRCGLPLLHSYGLERLFYKYGVDLELWAHEHTYEREHID